MNMIINLFGKFVTIIDVKTRKVIGVIENDVGLIRHILKTLREYEISSNNNGYLQFLNKNGETYLHRIIIEYYSKFDSRLLNILKDTEHHQVNHKNKMKWDNRLENLEIVTIKGNQLHKNNKDYKKEIVFSTEDLIKIKENLERDKQHEADKKYLEKVSKRNKENILNGGIYWNCKNGLYDNLYIRFSNTTKNTTKILSNTTISNMLNTFSYIIFRCQENTFFTNSNITYMVYEYNNYRTINILKNNMKLIFKYYNQNKYFRYILNKNHLLNDKYISKYKQEKITFDEYTNYNIIYYLFYYLLRSNRVPKSFTNNQLFTILSLNSLILTPRKYKYFRVLYILQLLNRRPTYYYNESNIPLDKKYKPRI